MNVRAGAAAAIADGRNLLAFGDALTDLNGVTVQMGEERLDPVIGLQHDDRAVSGLVLIEICGRLNDAVCGGEDRGPDVRRNIHAVMIAGFARFERIKALPELRGQSPRHDLAADHVDGLGRRRIGGGRRRQSKRSGDAQGEGCDA